MEINKSIRSKENLHILFWLIKDTCWMLEFKTLGAFMILPTLSVSIYILIKTLRTEEGFVNAAILCWISANSYWMFVEFFFHNQFKLLSIVPFTLGFVFVALHYFKRNR